MPVPRVIAYYLPQFHPFPDNDAWWGKGFTEWTNVGKAKPLFKGHYQPKVPADLGYYDLRLPDVRESQASLARDAGIEGFMYWHYWFGESKRLMERVFDSVLESGRPDFPFCLAWANHSWYAKEWNSHSGQSDKLLIEQKYGDGIEDHVEHFNFLLKAFRDSRYIKVDGKPVFLVFDPFALPRDVIPLWKELAQKNGLPGLHLIGRMPNKIQNVNTLQAILDMGYDAVTRDVMDQYYLSRGKIRKGLFRIRKILSRVTSLTIEYRDAIKTFYKPELDDRREMVMQILPNWDHSPRSGRKAFILHNSSPELFRQHAEHILGIAAKKEGDKIVLLKSWNEWAEGNYMEPDLKYGLGYISALRDALESVNAAEEGSQRDS